MALCQPPGTICAHYSASPRVASKGVRSWRHPGFNTVFSDKPGNCRLIDSDFGGDTARTTITYPEGYRPALEDGIRVRMGGELIETWHDWVALANLLFLLRKLVDPDRVLKDQFNDARYDWDALRKHESLSDALIVELKNILTDLTAAGVKCSPLDRFGDALDDNDVPVASGPAATGSPAQK
jgi:hypothetical protein